MDLYSSQILSAISNYFFVSHEGSQWQSSTVYKKKTLVRETLMGYFFQKNYN